MTEEKKTTEKTDDKKAAGKKADAPEQTEAQKWDAEHLDLVAKLQEAKQAVVDHRYPSAEALKTAAAAAEATVKAGVEATKKAAEAVVDKFSRDDEPKAGAKGPLEKSGSQGFRPDKF